MATYGRDGGFDSRSVLPLFNRDEREARISALPDSDRRAVRALQTASAQRRDDELKQQHRAHAFRLQREYVDLLVKYTLEDAPRPNSIEAKRADIQILQDQAEKNLKAREETYLAAIDRELDKAIEQIFKNAEQGRTHDRDTDRGRER